MWRRGLPLRWQESVRVTQGPGAPPTAQGLGEEGGVGGGGEDLVTAGAPASEGGKALLLGTSDLPSVPHPGV